MNAEKKMVVQVTAPHVQLRNLKAAMVNDFRAACARGEHGAAPASARGGPVPHVRTSKKRKRAPEQLVPAVAAESPRLPAEEEALARELLAGFSMGGAAAVAFVDFDNAAGAMAALAAGAVADGRVAFVVHSSHAAHPSKVAELSVSRELRRHGRLRVAHERARAANAADMNPRSSSSTSAARGECAPEKRESMRSLWRTWTR
mmetsp:Transcript_10826/g.35571  ORF Transcript_10826/g.35571 Transcript_10826/m.35571 type:complete len:203 (+) Transcript_10826:270-878(+)